MLKRRTYGKILMSSLFRYAKERRGEHYFVRWICKSIVDSERTTLQAKFWLKSPINFTKQLVNLSTYEE